MKLKLKLKGQIMYCQNFGVATETNCFAGAVARSTKAENRGVTAYETEVIGFPSVSEPPAIPEAAPVTSPKVEASTQAAVNPQPSTNSNAAVKKSRTNELEETAVTAAVFCLITAVGTLIFAPTEFEIRLLGSAIWLAIAVGIFMMSRTAAIIGLVLVAINIMVSVGLILNLPPSTNFNLNAIVLMGYFYIWWTKALYAAILGAFEYHRSPSTC